MKRYEFHPPPLEIKRSDAPPTEPPEASSAEAHRQIVTSSIIKSNPDGGGRCLILGAGFCGDLYLQLLAEHFDAVDLADLDPQALKTGVERQAAELVTQLTCHAPMDVSGIHEPLNDFRNRGDRTASIDEIISVAREAQLDSLPTDCALVASTGLLSQLVQHAVFCVGDDHPQFVELIQTLRLRHLQLLIHQCRPGGTVLLFHDFVSSQSLPELASVSPDDLPQLLQTAIDKNNFFHGMNPEVMLAMLRSESSLQSRIKKLSMSRAWLWPQESTLYATIAFQLLIDAPPTA